MKQIMAKVPAELVLKILNIVMGNAFHDKVDVRLREHSASQTPQRYSELVRKDVFNLRLSCKYFHFYTWEALARLISDRIFHLTAQGLEELAIISTSPAAKHIKKLTFGVERLSSEGVSVLGNLQQSQVFFRYEHLQMNMRRTLHHYIFYYELNLRKQSFYGEELGTIFTRLLNLNTIRITALAEHTLIKHTIISKEILQLLCTERYFFLLPRFHTMMQIETLHDVLTGIKKADLQLRHLLVHPTLRIPNLHMVPSYLLISTFMSLRTLQIHPSISESDYDLILSAITRALNYAPLLTTLNLSIPVHGSIPSHSSTFIFQTARLANLVKFTLYSSYVDEESFITFLQGRSSTLRFLNLMDNGIDHTTWANVIRCIYDIGLDELVICQLWVRTKRRQPINWVVQEFTLWDMVGGVPLHNVARSVQVLHEFAAPELQ